MEVEQHTSTLLTDGESEGVSSNGNSKRYATAEEILANAPKDIVEQDIENVFGGLTVRVRGLTAAQTAQVRKFALSIDQRRGGSMEMSWGMMERKQFEFGVIEPKFNEQQALMLHRTAGPSFARVIEVLDELSGMNKEELRKAQMEFQEF